MKEYLSIALASTLVVSSITIPSANAQSNSAVSNITSEAHASTSHAINGSIFSENFRKKVDAFIKISDDKRFNITNEEALKETITIEEFIQLTQQIEKINSQLQELKQEDLIIGDGKIVYDFTLDQQNRNAPIVLAKTAEGINRIEFYYWGYKIWLSKTTVNKILNVGTAGGAAALGAVLGNVPGAIIGAVVGSILSEFVNPAAARAIYMEVLYPTITIKIQVL